MAKILIVDDSLFQRRSIRRILKVAGYEIQEAGDGRQGLELLTAFVPDCIILDILMPDLDGLGFFRKLQEQGEKPSVIVLTADIQETTRQECLELGAKVVMHKPIAPGDADKFRHIVNDILHSEKEGMA
ncbi:MAG: response regulator [bacterium]|nr:response regulator [bacterium]